MLCEIRGAVWWTNKQAVALVAPPESRINQWKLLSGNCEGQSLSRSGVPLIAFFLPFFIFNQTSLFNGRFNYRTHLNTHCAALGSAQVIVGLSGGISNRKYWFKRSRLLSAQVPACNPTPSNHRTVDGCLLRRGLYPPEDPMPLCAWFLSWKEAISLKMIPPASSMEEKWGFRSNCSQPFESHLSSKRCSVKPSIFYRQKSTQQKQAGIGNINMGKIFISSVRIICWGQKWKWLDWFW